MLNVQQLIWQIGCLDGKGNRFVTNANDLKPMMIKVFKFGGASVKDAEAIRNMSAIIARHLDSRLLVVVSAMGKSTNMLESVFRDFQTKKDWEPALLEIKNYHTNIAAGIFETSDEIVSEIENTLQHLEDYLHNLNSEPEEQVYSEVVAYGERLSTQIIASFLNQNIANTQLLDASDYIKTDSSFVDARVNWPETCQKIQDILPSLQSGNIVLTQGFIGSNQVGQTTTLGREGSDFSAAIFAKCLQANSMTVWKDVPGILTADPRMAKSPAKIPVLSYKEASEMTFYGAKVIHPKTIRPLAESKIKLYVKPFNSPDDEGTVICEDGPDKYPPIFIQKKNQTLISFIDEELGFIDEEKIGRIFHAVHELNIKVNLMENSAVSFSICIDTQFDHVEKLIAKLRGPFKIAYNSNLKLFTIKNYDQQALTKTKDLKNILLEQKSRNTIHVLHV